MDVRTHDAFEITAEPLIELSRVLDRWFPQPEKPLGKDYWNIVAYINTRNSDVPEAAELAYDLQTIVTEIIKAELDPIKRDALIKVSPTYEQLLDIAARTKQSEISSFLKRYHTAQVERARLPRGRVVDQNGTQRSVTSIIKDLIQEKPMDTIPRLWAGFQNRLNELGLDPELHDGPKLIMQSIDFFTVSLTRDGAFAKRSLKYRSFANTVRKIRPTERSRGR